MKRGLIFVLLLIVLVSSAGAENLYVTQGGGGGGTSSSSPMSVSQFNSASKWGSGTGLISPGDTVYFSGTFTDQLAPPADYGGSASGGYVTLDGWEGGTCNPVADFGCSSAAVLDRPSVEKGGFTNYCVVLSDNNYVIIQDFEMRDSRGGIGGVGPLNEARQSTHLIIRRNYIHDMYGHAIQITQSGDPYWNGYDYLTIGGALGDGNLVYNTVLAGLDPTYQEDSHGVGVAGVNDFIISYNYIDNDQQDWTDASTTLSIHTGYRGLVEYNIVASPGGQACIAKKEYGGDDIIFRFNRIYNCGTGISISTDRGPQTDYYIYGNLVYNSIAGMRAFRNFDRIHFWSNIFHDFYGQGVSDDARAFYIITDSDATQGNVYLYNNILVRANYEGLDSEKGGGTYILGQPNLNLRVKNNIYWYNSVGEDNDRQMTIWDGSEVYVSVIDYNTYDSADTPYIRYQSSDRTISWINSEYGVSHNKVANPGFTDPNGQDNVYGTPDDDYTLNGNNINDGETLNSCFDVSVQGTNYHVCYSDALDPDRTDWTTTPPTVYTLNQNDYGAWERGAYVYTGGSVPTYSCTGSIPSNSIAYDSEESTGLTADTPWTFSATDTSVKCQYRCNTGYNWDGSACIAQAGTCPEGLITSTCSCGGTSYSSGYCCSGTWQSTSCSAPSTEYTILKTTTPPTINGDISEFADANEITLTDSLGTAGHYKFLWDSNYLYVAAEVYDTKLNALITQEDGNLYEDDSLELFFDAGNNGGAVMDYTDDYKFYININNAHADSFRFDTGWDSGMTSDVDTGAGTINNNGDTDTKYVIEARIPWANWKTPIDEEVWGMNLALNDRPDDATYPSDTLWKGFSMNVPNDAGEVTFSSQTITPPVTSSCTSGADISGNSVVEITELINFIGQWKSGSVSITELINAIGEWKAGC